MRETDDNISAEHIANPDVHHEYRDVNVRGVLVFAAVLLVSAIIIQLLLLAMFNYMERSAERVDPQPHPLASQERALPPEPRLQPDPVADMTSLRRTEDYRLNNYGWVDRDAGVAHIPIERAIDLVVQRGLPVRAGTAPRPAAPVAKTTEGSRESTHQPKQRSISPPQ